MLLRTKELLDAADMRKLRPRWDGRLMVTACPGPKAYTLALPRRMQPSPTVNVHRLKPFFERAGAEPAPGPVSDPGREGEHEAELLLHRKEKRGVTRYLVRWRGHTSEDDERLPTEELPHRSSRSESLNTRPQHRAASPPAGAGGPGAAAVASRAARGRVVAARACGAGWSESAGPWGCHMW